MSHSSQIILKPSKNKIFFFSILYLSLASACFFIEPLSNKITQGTYFIQSYESVFFYLLACYYLVQLLPGYAELIIDSQGIREKWFFKERLNIHWAAIDRSLCQVENQGDSVYLNSLNNQLFSRKKLCKGCYSLADKDLYSLLIEHLNGYPQGSKKPLAKPVNVKPKQYLVLAKMKIKLMLTLVFLLVTFNGYYLNNEQPDPDFMEQVQLWQQQNQQLIDADKQLFELLKVYGFYWKTQLKLFDRNLFQRILKQESRQIEALMIKRKWGKKNITEFEKKQFKQQLKDCRKQFLYTDEWLYFQCLEKI